MPRFSSYTVGPLLDLIAKYESGGSYQTVYGGIPKAARPADLTNLTVQQVLDWQQSLITRKLSPSTAAGRYQVIRKTLLNTYASAGLTPNSKFDVLGQDAIAHELLFRRGLQQFLDGTKSKQAMMVSLAQEWASLPVPVAMQGGSRYVQSGQSYYAGDGLNKAHATVVEVSAALDEVLRRHRGQPASSGASGAGGLNDILARLVAWLRRIFGG